MASSGVRFPYLQQYLGSNKQKSFISMDYQEGKFDDGFTNNNVVGGTENLSFSCKICFGLPRNGVELRQCGHTYCESCIKGYMRNLDPYRLKLTYPCPFCRTDFMDVELINLGKTSMHLLNQYKAIDVRCAYGCGFIGNPIGTVEHEKFICKQRPVACPNAGCTSTMTAGSMDAHIEVCEHRLIYCALCYLPRLANSRHDCVEDLRKTILRMCS